MERYILTVTLNASVDVACTVPGFAGGSAGQFIVQDLERRGVIPSYVEVAGESRSCFAITDPESGTITELREPGAQVSPEDVARFRAHFARLLDGADLVAISGSTPPGAEPTIDRDLVEAARSRGVRVVLDSSGAPLRAALGARPFLVKPNQAELSEWAGAPVRTAAEALDAAGRMRRAGPEWVLVSLGADGALLVGPEGRGWRAVPPSIRAVNTVGSGDSAVAGFAFGLAQGLPPEELVRLAVACGTANALTSGVADPDPAEVERLKREIRVERIGA